MTIGQAHTHWPHAKQAKNRPCRTTDTTHQQHFPAHTQHIPNNVHVHTMPGSTHCPACKIPWWHRINRQYSCPWRLVHETCGVGGTSCCAKCCHGNTQCPWPQSPVHKTRGVGGTLVGYTERSSWSKLLANKTSLEVIITCDKLNKQRWEHSCHH